MRKRKNRFKKKAKVVGVRFERRIRARLYYARVFFLRFRGVFFVAAALFCAGALVSGIYMKYRLAPKVIKPADYAAALEKGTRLYSKNRFEDAYAYLYPVRHAYPKAQLMLGKMYYEGWGVDRDVKQAYEYFKSAAETENDAKYMLAQMGFRGEARGLRKGLATKMLTEAAYAGVVDAQHLLGVFYLLSGEREQAYFWLSLAKKNGGKKAEKLTEKLKENLSSDEISLLDLEVAGFTVRK